MSRPSRAYLHLTNESHLIALSNHVRQLSFEDAANTYTSSCLLGPPTVEYAPYGRIPSGKRRTDARQGTIDLDPEFMDFLESLANPAPTKEEETDTAKEEKVTTTPLVQYLKDKKATKTKDSGSSKGSKSNRNEQSTSSGRLRTKETTEESPKKISRETKKEKVEKASREAVRILNREVARQTASSSQSQTANTPTEPPKNPRLIARERGSIAAAARILQRDLGLTPGNAHRRAKVEAEAAKSDATPPFTSQQAPKSGQPNGSNNGRNRGKGGNSQTAENDKPKVAPSTPPMVLLKKPVDNTAGRSGSSGPAAASSSRSFTPAARSANTPQPANNIPPSAPAALNKPAPTILNRRAQPAPVPSNGATHAFIKHANPSQGVTEPLLKEAMETFGAVSRVEIDKRKGFAYVDFVDSEGLKKAMAANPTRIAQGTVQVLERKDSRLPREQQSPRAPPQHPKHGHMAEGAGGSGGNNALPPGPSSGGRGPPRRGRGRNTGGTGNSAAPSGSGSAQGAKAHVSAAPTLPK